MTNLETNNREINLTEISSQNSLDKNLDNRLGNMTSYLEKSEIDDGDISLAREDTKNNEKNELYTQGINNILKKYLQAPGVEQVA
ncbi:hypothetical protein OAN96_00190 [Candidatus Gracilibacteria bacterium]|nr:hypothetical protein [Candidatus Gracilibacteria bacterium]